MVGEQASETQTTEQQQQGGEAIATAQQQNGNASGQEGGSQQNTSAEKTFSQADVNRLIDERLTRAKSKWEKDITDAAKPEAERIAAERETYKESAAKYRSSYRDVHAREVVRTEALQLGADPKRVDRIVKMVRPDLAFDDDDDTPTNVKQLLTELKKSDEDLFKPVVGKADGGSGSATKPKNQDVNAWLRQAAGRSSG